MPVTLLQPQRFGDDRGWFSETFSARRLDGQDIGVRFCQDNQSFSAARGVLRGLHFQTPPHAQDKLVSCLRGAIWDVAVDLRRDSPTYGRWVSAELSGDNGHQLFVPAGFGHGFVTLTEDTQVFYKVSDYYAPECESGIIWNDLELAIPWPLPESGPFLSAKDKELPSLRSFESPFPYDGIPLRPLKGAV